MKRLITSIVTILICLNIFSIGISNLTVEMQRTPLTIEADSPRFGWLLASGEKGDSQTAYQITVMKGNTKVWDSGKVKSNQSQLISYKGKKLENNTRYIWTVKVWDKNGKVAESASSFFETAPAFSPSDIQWIGAINRADANLPVGRRDFHGPSFKKPEYKELYDKIDTLALRSINLRKSFHSDKKIERAIVHVSGLGHYNLYLNGKLVSKDIFTPAWSDYDKTVYYNTYQVDSLLVGGENVIGVTLGNGFYNAVGNQRNAMFSHISNRPWRMGPAG